MPAGLHRRLLGLGGQVAGIDAASRQHPSVAVVADRSACLEVNGEGFGVQGGHNARRFVARKAQTIHQVVDVEPCEVVIVEFSLGCGPAAVVAGQKI